MTDETNPEPVEEPSSSQLPPGEKREEEAAEEPEGGKANRDAAKYRVRLRAAEERISTMQRAEAVRLAGDRLVDGDDVFRGGDLTDFLTEDGDLDTDKVNEVVAKLALPR